MDLLKEKNKGITLIALVITIIVLLILVAVAINAITDDGIIEKANQSTTEQLRAALEESLNMELISKYAGNKGNDVQFLDFMKELQENKKYNIKFSGDKPFIIYNNHVFEAVYENNKIKIIYIGTESEVEIEEDGGSDSEGGDEGESDDTTGGGTGGGTQGGTGGGTEGDSQEEWIKIYTIQELVAVKNDLSKNYILMNDLDLSSSTIEPIGAQLAPFTGRFNGNGKTIKNLTINSTADNVGLFGYTSSSAVISNLTVENAYIKGNNNVGIVVGNNSGTLDGIGVTGKVEGTGSNIGGVIGNNELSENVEIKIQNISAEVQVIGSASVESSGLGGVIGTNKNYGSGQIILKRISSKATVTGASYNKNLGGLIGNSENKGTGRILIEECYAVGNINSQNINSGGLVGNFSGYNSSCSSNTTIKNSYAVVDVKSTSSVVGGFVGNLSYATIANTYNVGKVEASSNVGGYVATTTNSTIANSYWSYEVAGTIISNGGIASLIDDMLTKSNYKNWDFTEIWGIEEGTTLPYLRNLQIPDEVYKVNIEYTPVTEGSGTVSDPYLIKTPLDLYNVRNNLTAYYLVAADIDLSGYENWEPIYDFGGYIEGQGYTIKNLTINNPSSDYQGLFGTSGGTIKNIQLKDINVTASSFTGGLVGQNTGTINNVVVTGTVTGNGYVGGIVGRNLGSILIANVEVEVSGNAQVGGAVGWQFREVATVSNVAVKGIVKAITNASSVGGLIGECDSKTTISLCRTDVTVDGGTGSNIGGLIGQTKSSSQMVIEKCYSEGSVSGNQNVGGLIGYSNVGTIKNCYSVANVTSTNGYTGGLIGKCSSTAVTNTYATGKVEGSTSNSGGLIGYSSGTTVTNGYWIPEISGRATSSGGIATTVTALIQEKGYTGFDFTEIWDIEEGVTLAYLRNMGTPDEIYQENITYLEMQGLGTEESPYLISTADQLNAVRNVPLATYKIIKDIDLSSYENWEPMEFKGTIDGNGHEISNLTVQNSSLDNQGLISTNSGTVKNIKLSNANVVGNQYVGGLIGNNSGKVTNIEVQGKVSGINYIGGIIGNNIGEISNIKINTEVSGQTSTGGAIGQNTGTITSIESTGIKVEGMYNYTGGLLGYNTGAVTNIKTTGGEISGSSNYTGILMGYNAGAISGIEVTGDIIVAGTTYVGGLIGHNVVDIANVKISNKITVKATGDGIGGISGINNGKLDTIELLNIDITGGNYIGGIAGQSTATVNNVIVKGTVTGVSFTGGLIGENTSTINNAVVKETVTGNGYVGGIVGRNLGSISIANAEVEVSGNGQVGGAVGWQFREVATVSNVAVKGTVKAITNASSVGGLIGECDSKTTISLCRTDVTVDGGTGSDIGGLIGQTKSSSQMVIEKSYSEGSVSGKQNVGGLIGCSNVGTIQNCYSVANVTSTNGYSGGLIGKRSGATVTNTYATGKVEGSTSNSGGLIGYSSSTTITSSYWNTDICSVGTIGTGLSTTQFADTTNFVDWDFQDIWKMDTTGYPKLRF